MTASWTSSGTTYTAVKMNVTDTASNAASLLADFQVGGSSKASIQKDGAILASPSTGFAYVGFANSYLTRKDVQNGSNSITTTVAGVPELAVQQAGIVARSLQLGTSSGTAITSDVFINRDAANTLAQRNSTNAQTFYVYNTTDGTNSERGFMKWNANVLEIGAEKVGTGTPRNVLIKSNSGVLTLNDGNSAMTLLSGDLQIGTRAISQLTNIVAQTGYHEMQEMTAPAAPSANRVRIYAEDNGSGKTRLMALFPTGAAQQIAIEP